MQILRNDGYAYNPWLSEAENIVLCIEFILIRLRLCNKLGFGDMERVDHFCIKNGKNSSITSDQAWQKAITSLAEKK